MIETIRTHSNFLLRIFNDTGAEPQFTDDGDVKIDDDGNPITKTRDYVILNFTNDTTIDRFVFPAEQRTQIAELIVQTMKPAEKKKFIEALTAKKKPSKAKVKASA